MDDELFTFLQSYPTKLHYLKTPSFFAHSWVFWSQNDMASPHSFPSDDPDPQMIHKKILSALSVFNFFDDPGLIQFWAPVKIGGRQLLTTSDQPFFLSRPDDSCKEYRLRSLEYQYDIDVNNFEVEKNPKIITGAPAKAFQTRVTVVVSGLTVPQDYPLVYAASVRGGSATYVLPIFSDPYQSCCIGVFECYISGDREATFERFHFLLKNICGLGDVKDEIDKALPVILKSSHVPVILKSSRVEFVQVWIVYEDEDYVAFSSALEDTQRKRMLGFKLTSRCADDVFKDYAFYVLSNDCIPLANNGIWLAERALQNNEARFCADFSQRHKERDKCSFTICLKNNKTRHLVYVLEFFWNNQCSDYIVMLESLFSILKRCLPSFKFASGAQLGDELSVIDVDGFTGSEKGCFRIFEGKGSSLIPNALYEGGRSVVLVEESLNGEWKTDEKELPIEKIKQQFGKTMKEVAQNLNGDELLVIDGDELRVIDGDDSTGSGSDCLQTLKGNGSTSTSNALDKGKRSVVLVEKSLNKKCKTTKIEIPTEKMEEQFGQTMGVAKQNLGVSLSTLKRKWTEYVDNARKKDPDFNGDWPGPNYKKTRVKDPDNGHRDTDDENNGATKGTLAINRNKNGLTIKAEYAGDMIKFNFPISSATFGAVEKKIGEEFGLNPGTYKLKYRDQEEDWILLKSDEHMESCIESSGSIIRLRVVDIQT